MKYLQDCLRSVQMTGGVEAMSASHANLSIVFEVMAFALEEGYIEKAGSRLRLTNLGTVRLLGSDGDLSSKGIERWVEIREGDLEPADRRRGYYFPFDRWSEK